MQINIYIVNLVLTSVAPLWLSVLSHSGQSDHHLHSPGHTTRRPPLHLLHRPAQHQGLSQHCHSDGLPQVNYINHIMFIGNQEADQNSVYQKWCGCPSTCISIGIISIQVWIISKQRIYTENFIKVSGKLKTFLFTPVAMFCIYNHFNFETSTCILCSLYSVTLWNINQK